MLLRFNSILNKIIHKIRKKAHHFFFLKKIKEKKTIQLLLHANYTENPEVSFIIQSYNHAKNIKSLIQKLRLFKRQEIIVCEDGSVDNSLKEWKKYLNQSNDFIICSNDLHEIRTYNRAGHLAKGRILCFLQDDDILPNNTKWLDDALTLFQKVPKLAVLGGKNAFYLPELSKKALQNLNSLQTYHNEIDFNQIIEKIKKATKLSELSYVNILDFFEKNIHNAIKNKHFLIPLNKNELKNKKNIPLIENIPFKFSLGINVGPVFITKNHFINVKGFDLEYSPPGYPGIHFDIAFALKTWINNFQAGYYLPSFQYGKGGCGTIEFGCSFLRNQQDSINRLLLLKNYGLELLNIQDKVNKANSQII